MYWVFDSPCFLLTSLVVCSLFLFKAVAQFRGEFSAIEANHANSHPTAVDADIASINITLPNPGLRSTSKGFGIEIVGLEFHVRSTINAGWF